MENILVLPASVLEDKMRLGNVGRVSDKIANVLEDTGEDSKVYLNVMVPPSHKELIQSLARINKTKQAVVVRAIIDEWCESKAKNSNNLNGGAA